MPMKYNLPAELDHKQDWVKLVRYFICRDLTYSSDRLPAMAAIASHMHCRNPSLELFLLDYGVIRLRLLCYGSA
ncbi:hypothetical protein GGI43DRAFT_406951 [Trichoderma evansii]